jgi:hypothetical protein
VIEKIEGYKRKTASEVWGKTTEAAQPKPKFNDF